MHNRTVLLIGGGSEIGAAIADYSRSNGYAVVTTTREGRGDSLPVDVRSDASVRTGIEQALRRTGRIDSLIYAPAITDSKLTHVADISAWQDVYNVNVLGALRVTRELLPHFMKQRDGTCVYISSSAALHGVVGSAAYAASKAALNSLAKSVSKEYGRFNIRAYTVMPGYVSGGMLKDMDPQRVQELSRSIALRRFAQVDEIAQFTVASLGVGYLSGTALSIDGGIDA